MGTAARWCAISAQLQQDTVQRRLHHYLAPGAHLQGMAGVVDVFAGAGESGQIRLAFSSSGHAPLNFVF
jgi:hypothetical protein